MPAWKTRPCSAARTAARPGRSFPGCAAPKATSGSPAPAACASTRSSWIRASPSGCVIAISAAGVFRTDDAGKTWRPANSGLKSPYELPDPDAEVGHCVHRIAMHPSRPGVLFMQKHWDVMRSDNAGDSWHEVSGNLPSDFGFPDRGPCARTEDASTSCPIKSDSEHFPPGRQAARLPEPDRRERMGSAHPGSAAA